MQGMFRRILKLFIAFVQINKSQAKPLDEPMAVKCRHNTQGLKGYIVCSALELFTFEMKL